MARDGTNRGGPRPGTGPKKKPLAEKIEEGTAIGTMYIPGDLPEPNELEGEEVPEVSEYLKRPQKNGEPFYAEQIFIATWKWLKARGCEKLVNKHLIEQYAVSYARWIQCEDVISEYGKLAKHPTTGNAIASPYVAMSKDYKKQINMDWYQIYQIVKDNCSVAYEGDPSEDIMATILRIRNRRNEDV